MIEFENIKQHLSKININTPTELLQTWGIREIELSYFLSGVVPVAPRESSGMFMLVMVKPPIVLVEPRGMSVAAVCHLVDWPVALCHLVDWSRVSANKTMKMLTICHRRKV
jgi:hypothetical protein